MPAGKIRDESEVIGWFREGRTYAWMVEEYRRKYDIETVPSMWGNFRRRRGLPRRATRDDELIPWAVRREHRWAWAVNMLRTEARRRRGASLSQEMAGRLDGWLRGLDRDGTVVHYDPETPAGWSYVPRREGIDTDIIRRPERPSTRRPAAD